MQHLAQPVLDIINRLIDREGGLSDNPADRGGTTYAGITLPTLSRYLGHEATVDDLKALDHETIVNIYYTMFWIATRAYRVYEVDARFGEFVFDWFVCSGYVAATHFQAFVGAKVDGVIGDKTLEAFRDIIGKNIPRLFDQLVDVRERFLIDVCMRDHSQLSFLRGWYNRVKALRYI